MDSTVRAILRGYSNSYGVDAKGRFATLLAIYDQGAFEKVRAVFRASNEVRSSKMWSVAAKIALMQDVRASLGSSRLGFSTIARNCCMLLDDSFINAWSDLMLGNLASAELLFAPYVRFGRLPQDRDAGQLVRALGAGAALFVNGLYDLIEQVDDQDQRGLWLSPFYDALSASSISGRARCPGQTPSATRCPCRGKIARS